MVSSRLTCCPLAVGILSLCWAMLGPLVWPAAAQDPMPTQTTEKPQDPSAKQPPAQPQQTARE